MTPDLTGWAKNKTDLQVQLFAEKKLGNIFSVRPELGYIQKGYKEDITMVDVQGKTLGTDVSKFTFNNLSLDMSVKFSPFKTKLKPYLLLGLRGSYLLSCKAVNLDYQGVKTRLSTKAFDVYNNVNLGGLIGMGVIYRNLYLIEMEYNPGITKIYESPNMLIKERYFSLTLGINIEKLIGGRKE